MAKNWISPLELSERLNTPNPSSNLVIFDTQFNLPKPDLGRQLYLEGHLPGAIFLDVNLDLSSAVTPHGGRHPLPDWAVFVGKLEAAGVSNTSEVVIYDDMGSMYAVRLWWLLKYLGHDNVKVLNGGLNAWLEAGFEMKSGEAQAVAQKGTFVASPRAEMLVDMDFVRSALESGEFRLLDARAAERFRGENETIDPVAGHIPTAQSFPFAENLEGGKFKDLAALERRFAGIDDQTIVYCGSGVTAAHNFIVLDELGVRPKLYGGSWSDWISYPENEIARG
jgi:thiosulfate/3-mercaptopyruvate sulfurtransferase